MPPPGCNALRALYEPHAQAIANYLGMSLPAWIPEPRAKDQWKLVELVRSKAAAQLTQNSPLNPEAIATHLHSEEH
jgi:hypothetical protein